jgi:uncharacterized protein YyaL (SSP411 family)
MLDDKRAESRAAETIRAFAGQLQSLPLSLPAMLGALLFSASKSRQIVIAGHLDEEGTEALARVARELATPDTVLLYADAGPGQAWLAERLKFMRSAVPLNGRPAAYVCENFACRLPVTQPEELRKELM